MRDLREARTVAILLILFVPAMASFPAVAAQTSGPAPIPANLIPAPSAGSPITPWNPNLGTTSTALPAFSPYAINKSQSGLVASDPLNNATRTQQQLAANSGFWAYNGSAPGENAPYAFYRDNQGLHVGAQAPANGTWAGYYASSPNQNAMLFHSVVSVPVGSIPYQWYDAGLYVQTSAPFVNYVTCAVTIGAWGPNWAIVSTTGNATDAVQYGLLWVDNSPNQPLTRDCTLVTNGDNHLEAYLDGTLVYSNNTMKLQMPSPFNAYLEPQSSYPAQMINSTFVDYYATTGENILVKDNPPIAAADKLVSPSGLILASAPVDSSGTATLGIGHYHMPLGAYIKVYDQLGNQIASTQNPVGIFGGDVYSVSLN